MTGAPRPLDLLHPPVGGPDEDALAELVFDLEDGTAPPELAAHVAGCPACGAVLAALGATVADLRAELTPLPDAVRRRLTESLAVIEHPPTSVPVPETAEPSPAAPIPLDAARRGRHRARDDERDRYWRVRRLRAVSGVAAALIVVGGVGYLGVTGLGGDGSDFGASDTAAEGGGSGADEESVTTDGDGAVPSYDRQSLRAAVPELLGRNVDTEGGTPPLPVEPVPGAAAAVDDECLASLPVATASAVSITRAVYDGQPAIVVLFAPAGSAVQVTVLSDCDGGPPTVLDSFEAPI